MAWGVGASGVVVSGWFISGSLAGTTLSAGGAGTKGAAVAAVETGDAVVRAAGSGARDGAGGILSVLRGAAFGGAAVGRDGGFAEACAEFRAAPAWGAAAGRAAMRGFGLAAPLAGIGAADGGLVTPFGVVSRRAGLHGVFSAEIGSASVALAAVPGAAALATAAGRPDRVAFVSAGGGFGDNSAAGCLRTRTVVVIALRSLAADAFMGEPRLSNSSIIHRCARTAARIVRKADQS